MYQTILQMVDSLFDPKLNALLRPINKYFYDSYYISSGVKLDNVVCISNELTIFSDNIRIIIGKSKDNITAKDILYINAPTLLYIIPENIINGEVKNNSEIIITIFRMYKYISDHTKPSIYIDSKSTYARGLDLIPIYLTIITINNWFTGCGYSDFEENIYHFGNICNKESYEAIVNTIRDASTTPYDILSNYSAICELFSAYK